MATCTGARRERRAHWRQGGAPAGSLPPATDGPSTRSPDHREQGTTTTSAEAGARPIKGPPPAGQPFGRDRPCALGARRPLRGTSGLVRELRPRCLTSCARGTSRASGNHPAIPVDHPNELGHALKASEFAEVVTPKLYCQGRHWSVRGPPTSPSWDRGSPSTRSSSPNPAGPVCCTTSSSGSPALPGTRHSPTEAPHCVPLAPGSGSAIRRTLNRQWRLRPSGGYGGQNVDRHSR